MRPLSDSKEIFAAILLAFFCISALVIMVIVIRFVLKKVNQNVVNPIKRAIETPVKPKLLQCRVCGNEVSSNARACPHCGDRLSWIETLRRDRETRRAERREK